MKVYIEPTYRGEDKGDGGIRRVVDAQRKWLPEFGVEVVEEIGDADLVATHATSRADVPNYKPWVAHCHGLYWREYEWQKWAHVLNRDVISQLTLADHITVPSEWVGYAIKRGMWREPTVLHHGIDPDEFAPGTNRGYVLWNKNRPDPICDPTPVNELASRISSMRFLTTFGAKADNVEIVGKVPYDQMKSLVADAGVYLCTTRETFGVGTLEAMASGVPVVGWNWGGQREIIEHGVDGWLAAPGDYDGLIQGITWALDNRQEVGLRGRQKAIDRFTWRAAMERYAELYARLIDAKTLSYESVAVSVVIPCYNLARFLPEAVRSVQGQTARNWEIIIVDDDSPDDTAAVARTFADADPRIRYIKNPTNLYLAGALNRGIRESRGRYIVALDADNMIPPDTIETLATILEGDRGTDIAYGAVKFVLPDGITPDTSVAPDGVSAWPTDFSFRGQMNHRNQIPSTCMFRREVWSATGGYRERCQTAEDADFWTRASSFGFKPRKVTTKITLIYRQRADSMSRSEPDWGWNDWFPWARSIALVPFAAPMTPPTRINQGLSWHVPSYEPRRVVVVIPVGDGHQKLLIDALDSVQAQSCIDWECVVYNDTGAPLEVPHPWANVLNQDGSTPPRGPAYARNRAIEASSCPVFVPLDADDYLQPDALVEMLKVHDEFGGVAYPGWFDDLGDEMKVADPPEYDARLLTKRGCLHCITALYPRSAWEQVGGFDEDLTHWEDWDFQIALANIGVCGTKISRPLFTYRKTTGKRREENIGQFEAGKAVMLAKWSKVWNGEDLMACGSCPGGGGGKYSRPPATVQQGHGGVNAMGAQEGYKLVRYMGRQTGTRSYSGKTTNQRYRFSASPSHVLKYVLDGDVQGLLEFSEGGRPLFEVQASVGPQSPQQQVEEGPVLGAERVATQESGTLSFAPSTEEPKQEVSHDNDPIPNDVTDLTRTPVKQLAVVIADWSPERVSVALAKERSGPQRVTAIETLEKRLAASA